MSHVTFKPWALAVLLAVGSDTPPLSSDPLAQAVALQRRAQYVAARVVSEVRSGSEAVATASRGMHANVPVTPIVIRKATLEK